MPKDPRGWPWNVPHMPAGVTRGRNQPIPREPVSFSNARIGQR